MIGGKVLYNSEEVMTKLQREFDKPEHSPVIAAVNDYANTKRGCVATENLMGSGDSYDQATFRDGAAKHVRKELYGGFGGLLVWIVVKPFVMAIIERFIESLLSASE